ncbi:hypothetical protein ACFC1R_06795 [Kitasatospora sp. NPDC056138]|uniref:hypothetical protein n=1 Tax=Kitasatospora sp. NPDC056138 TaxID=3345724 RepID=UPI0035D5FF92
MRIELTWPRSHSAEWTLAVPVPEVPAVDLLRPALRRVQQSAPGLLRQALAHAEPVASSAAGAAGAGALVRLTLPFAVRLVQQSLDPRG